MNRGGAIRLILGAVILGLLGLYIARHLQVTNDITHFLPEGSDRRVAEVSRQLADSELSGTMILAVEGPDRASAAAGASALAAELAPDPEVAWIRRGVDEGTQQAFYDLYFPRRLYFLGDGPAAELGERFEDRGLREAARALKHQLELPTAPLVRRIAPADPLLAFGAQIDRLRAMQDDALRLEGDQFVSADDRHGLLFLGSRASPFMFDRQQKLLASIDGAFQRVNAARGGALKLESSGVSRFAVTAERSIKADIARISTLSTAAVVVLFLLAFRSVRYVLVGMIPLLAGTLCAMAAGLALFGKLHGLTLAFGSSLIGTGIDYAEHYFTHHTLAPDPDGPEAGFRRLWPGLLLGALTTIAGLAGLAWTSFPGIREIAVFSSVGVAGALFATRWLVPQLTPRSPRPVRLSQDLARAFGRGLGAMMRGRRLLWLLPAAGIAISAIGMPRVRWVDDISALNTIDPALVAEDARVRGLVTGADAGRFVVALGDGDEQALAANDAVARRLDEARREGLCTGYRSLHALLWSAEAQRRSRDAVMKQEGLAARLGAAFEAEGFVPSAFQPFADSLAEAPPPPLTFDALLHSPLADLVRPFRVAVGGRIAVITPVTGVRDGDALAKRLADLPDVVYLDQRRFLDDAYGRFRARTYEMIGVGLLVVFAIVHARYRRLRLSLAAFLPSVLAATVTMSVLTLAGSSLNLMHLVGILLVLSSGADYSIFVVESREHHDDLGATMLSLVVGMFTTVFSFGLLGMSANPALRALGLTAGLGVLLSMLLAPAALILLGAAKEQE
jgi:predicted exporter